jgi:hypothetical protein
MGLGAGVFDEHELAFGLWFPWGAEQGNEDTEAAAVEGSADDTAGGHILDRAEAFSGADGVGLAGEGGEKAGHVDTVFAVEVGGDHGAMEGGKAEPIEQVELDGSEIAVGEEGLGVFADEIEIEAGEEVVGAIATTDGGNSRGVGVGECAVEVGEAMAGSAGEEEGAALKGVGPEAGLEAEVAEAAEPFLDAFFVGIGGGREDGDSGSGGGGRGAK